MHDFPVKTYQHNGYQCQIELETGYQIWIDWFNQDYSIKKDGVEIAGHDATFCQIDNNQIAFYARRQKDLIAPLPAGWDPALVVARALYTDHREEVPVRIENGNVEVSVQSGRPVMVFRDAARADKSRLQIAAFDK